MMRFPAARREEAASTKAMGAIRGSSSRTRDFSSTSNPPAGAYGLTGLLFEVRHATDLRDRVIRNLGAVAAEYALNAQQRRAAEELDNVGQGGLVSDHVGPLVEAGAAPAAGLMSLHVILLDVAQTPSRRSRRKGRTSHGLALPRRSCRQPAAAAGLSTRARIRSHARQLAAIEDRHILGVLKRQQDAGLKIFTDGELRRTGFMGDFYESVDGLDPEYELARALEGRPGRCRHGPRRRPRRAGAVVAKIRQTKRLTKPRRLPQRARARRHQR